ncbi:MAG: hypothetical protein PHZ00_07365, partial [Candidatus Peribacteraceae bacterium]|nr:hypothetical protein [Candidatus Peribacteraceae bacterium]
DEPTVCVMKNICGSKCSLACFLNFDHEKECQISLPTRLPEEARNIPTAAQRKSMSGRARFENLMMTAL